MSPADLISLDLRAAAGDGVAARQARWLDQHPTGAQTAEEWAEASALGFG